MRRTCLPVLALTVLLPVVASAQEATPRLQLLATIGCQDCSGPQMLADVRRIVVANQQVYVLEGGAPHVRVFDKSGRSIISFGRQGGGPGEFRFPTHLNVHGEGQLEVYDFGHGRFIRLGADGAELSTRTLNLGQFPVLSSTPGNRDTYVVTSEFRDTVQRILRIAAETDAPTPVPSPIPLHIGPDRQLTRPAMAAHPALGVAVGDGSNAYRIVLIRPNGTVALEIERRVRRVRKTEAELGEERRVADRMRQYMSQRIPRGNVPPVAADPYRRHFSAIAFDDSGRLWVRTLRQIDATVFDVFGSGGRYLGEVVLPGRVGAFGLGQGLIAVAVRDELGVPYVNVYAIR